MNSKQQQLKTLLMGIQQDYKNYTTLLEQLTEQRGVIIERKTERLTELNQQITALYQQISATTEQRLTLLNLFNIPPNAEGMQAFFSRLPVSHQTQVTRLWHKLEQQVKTCQQLNERNAQLLHMQQEILHSLLGESQQSIYQP